MGNHYDPRDDYTAEDYKRNEKNIAAAKRKILKAVEKWMDQGYEGQIRIEAVNVSKFGRRMQYRLFSAEPQVVSEVPEKL